MMPYGLPPAETWLPLSAIVRSIFPGTPDFAEALRVYLQAARCIVADSARTLLYWTFRHLRGQPGSARRTEVLLPGYTCYSLAASAVKAGLTVAFYDLDPHTLQPDIEHLERSINERTLAVIVQHLLGIPANVGDVAELAHAHGACCIEDSAQRLEQGSASGGTHAADYTIYSFGRGKPLPLGVGGALVAAAGIELPWIPANGAARRHEVIHRLAPIAIRICAWPRFYWILEKLPLGLGRTVYDPSFSCCPMPLASQRLGTASLAHVAMLNRHRVAIGEVYRTHFQDSAEPSPFQTSPAYLRYPLFVDNQCAARRLARHGVRPLYPLPLGDLPALEDHHAVQVTATSGAREIATRLVTLPTHLQVNVQTATKLACEARRVFTGIRTVCASRAHCNIANPRVSPV